MYTCKWDIIRSHPTPDRATAQECPRSLCHVDGLPIQILHGANRENRNYRQGPWLRSFDQPFALHHSPVRSALVDYEQHDPASGRTYMVRKSRINHWRKDLTASDTWICSASSRSCFTRSNPLWLKQCRRHARRHRGKHTNHSSFDYSGWEFKRPVDYRTRNGVDGPCATNGRSRSILFFGGLVGTIFIRLTKTASESGFFFWQLLLCFSHTIRHFSWNSKGIMLADEVIK